MKTDMSVIEFPGCCKANCIVYFGGGDHGEPQDWCNSEEDILSDLRAIIGEMARRKTPRLLFATTTSRQENASAALEKVGFTKTSEISYESWDDDLDDQYDHFVYSWTLATPDYKG